MNQYTERGQVHIATLADNAKKQLKNLENRTNVKCREYKNNLMKNIFGQRKKSTYSYNNQKSFAYDILGSLHAGPALTTRQTRHLPRAPKQEGPQDSANHNNFV